MTRKLKQPETDLYTLQQGAESYIVTKWDSLGLEMLSQYIMPVIWMGDTDREIGCTCPQGTKPTCRHRRMLPTLLERIDTNWFYCFGTGDWRDPTGNAEVMSGPPEPSIPVDESGLEAEQDNAEVDDESIHAVGDQVGIATVEEVAPPLTYTGAKAMPTLTSVPRRRVV